MPSQLSQAPHGSEHAIVMTADKAADRVSVGTGVSGSAGPVSFAIAADVESSAKANPLAVGRQAAVAAAGTIVDCTAAGWTSIRQLVLPQLAVVLLRQFQGKQHVLLEQSNGSAQTAACVYALPADSARVACGFMDVGPLPSAGVAATSGGCPADGGGSGWGPDTAAFYEESVAPKPVANTKVVVCKLVAASAVTTDPIAAASILTLCCANTNSLMSIKSAVEACGL